MNLVKFEVVGKEKVKTRIIVWLSLSKPNSPILVRKQLIQTVGVYLYKVDQEKD